ncbi:hypothetical protein NFX46_34340 [Streptomyces phaeoluteigriseus]|uniref:KTSC domain-containing protein n=1 Tax=Streptomyces phaeoluteigriseus TaxID=114686 RepID=A0ABY4ZHA6_9ACTN|nr:hypothetical protein [Streptomyces phaeoluteigriseus]USQ88389.1 hypothetical protein NFX46_34340 [Streptomyces phaeoluteigriseus]
MPEYAISTQSGAGWPAPAAGALSRHLAPRSLPYEIVDDSDVLVLRIAGATVTVSWELADSWYVDIEGSPSAEWADSVASEIAGRLGQATGERAAWYRVTD